MVKTKEKVWIRVTGMDQTDVQKMHLLGRRMSFVSGGAWTSQCGQFFNRERKELEGVRVVRCKKCKAIWNGKYGVDGTRTKMRVVK